MRFLLRHEIVHRFASPTRGVVREHRLHPSNFEGQYVQDWHFDVDPDCRLRFGEDCYGNLIQGFSLDGPIDAITVIVESQIDTEDTAGVARDVERFPPEFYLRTTPLTPHSTQLQAFARDACGGESSALAKLHALLPAVCNAFVWRKKAADHAAGKFPGAREILEARKGDCRDLAHVFIAGARSMGIPARFVSGYCLPGEGENDPAEASHCWAEAWAGEYGWIGFDPAIGVCPGETHVRMAIGLDWLAAAPSRSAHSGGDDETMETRVEMRLASPAGAMDRN